MSRTHLHALTVFAAALLLAVPMSADAQRAPLVRPTHPIAHPVFRVQRRSAAEQMTRLRALPNGPAILSAAERRGIIINSRSNTPSGSSAPPMATRSAHLAQSPTSGSGGSGGTVHGSSPVGSGSSGSGNNGHTAMPASPGSSGSNGTGNRLVPLATEQVVSPGGSMSAHWQGGSATLMVQGVIQPDHSVLMVPMPPSSGGAAASGGSSLSAQAVGLLDQAYFGTPPGTPQPNVWLDVNVNTPGWYVVDFAVYTPTVTVPGPSYMTLHALEIEVDGAHSVTCDDHVLTASAKNGMSSCMALVQLHAGTTNQITLVNGGAPTVFVSASISSAVQ